jgi:phenylpropionate dioxygenase-like ring-hydroxylating dioxygenase large terminal subunit
MVAMPKFPKPSEGSWTEHYPGLGTGPVSYEDSISREFYEAEQEAVFLKSWLNIGRIEQLPRNGSYFTRELTWAKRSLLIVKGSDGKVRAFHNMCRHRGNKLVWDDYPNEETSGTCRQFTCKYHAWRFDLDGKLNFVQQESEFFDLDKETLGLVPVACDVWEGFIFINLAKEPTQSLAEFLGAMGTGLAGFPFGEMTTSYTYRSEVSANWKLYVDAFVEFYHAPVLHQKQSTSAEGQKLASVGFEALHYELFSPHSMVSSWGGMSPPKDPSMVKPIENMLRSGLFGPWESPGVVEEFPKLVNPSKHRAWGTDSFVIFPNFMILIWERQWYLTYHYWPTSENTHVFETTIYFVPPKTPLDRMRQELAVATTKEFALQDANTLEATQKMIETGVVDTYNLNDQEILCRHHHAVVKEYVRAHQTGTPVSFPWQHVLEAAKG